MANEDGPRPPGGLADIPSRVGFGGLLGQAWKLYATTWRRQFLLFAPLLVVVFALQGAVIGGIAQDDKPAATQVLALILLDALLPALVGSLLVAGSHVIIVDRLVGRRLAPADSLRTLTRVRPQLLLSGVLSMTLEMTFFLLRLSNLLFVVWGPPVIVSSIALEGVALSEALQLMRKRMQGSWLRIIASLVAITLIVATTSLIVSFSAVVAATAPFAGRPSGNPVFVRAIFGLVFGLTLPYLAAAMLVAYFDGRARTEDFGLSTIAAERAAMLEPDQ